VNDAALAERARSSQRTHARPGPGWRRRRSPLARVAAVFVAAGAGYLAWVEAMTGFAYLRERGVPEVALLVENGSTNTWEQLLATELILDERGLSSAILVSDPSHCRRLLDTAAELGIAADVAPTSAPLPWSERLRETAGVAVGDVIGFRRLSMLAG